MTISPLIAAFFATPPERREPAAVEPGEDQRTRSLDNDPLWRAARCDIPRRKIDGVAIGLTHSMLQEQGTVYCPWCDDDCATATTPQREAAYAAHIAWLKRHNTRCRHEHEQLEPRLTEENVNAERRTVG